MREKIIRKFSERFVSKWIVLGFDLITVILTYFFIVLRFNEEIAAIEPSNTFSKLVPVLTSFLLGFLITRSYQGTLRHSDISEIKSLFKATLIAVSFLFGFNILGLTFTTVRPYLYIPDSLVIIQFLATLFLLTISRLSIRSIYRNFLPQSPQRETKVLIYGVGTSGMITKNTLLQDTSKAYRVCGFIDDNHTKAGKTVDGITVYTNSKALSQNFIRKHGIEEVIISIQKKLPARRKAEIVDQCIELGLRVRIVPSATRWLEGDLSANNLKPENISDLLERDPIQIENDNIDREVSGKRILVTGAAGSIGSEICRQLLQHKPSSVTLLDISESGLYELEYELHRLNKYNTELNIVVGNINDTNRIDFVFNHCKPEIIYHAAAYKQVPVMEENPYEAITTNVFGSKHLIDTTLKQKVEKFVLVSTDKAINPTNVMGATKRLSEIYLHSLVNSSKGMSTQFVVTRFGNVLDSNGSVVPLFRKQISHKGPITLTDKNATRYFMTIKEACHLVLEAGAMGKGGETFVFDMGKPVSIYNLAKKMIILAGMELGRDIQVVETGLRPGEKLHEERTHCDQISKRTHHPKILVSPTAKTYDIAELELRLDKLKKLLEGYREEEFIKLVFSLIALKSNEEEASIPEGEINEARAANY